MAVIVLPRVRLMDDKRKMAILTVYITVDVQIPRKATLKYVCKCNAFQTVL